MLTITVNFKKVKKFKVETPCTCGGIMEGEVEMRSNGGQKPGPFTCRDAVSKPNDNHELRFLSRMGVWTLITEDDALTGVPTNIQVPTSKTMEEFLKVVGATDQVTRQTLYRKLHDMWNCRIYGN